MSEQKTQPQVVQVKHKFAKGPRPIHSVVVPTTLVRGILMFDKDNSTRVESVDIYLDGWGEEYGHVGNYKVQEHSEGVQFEIEMKDLNRMGTYKVVWNMVISNKASPIIDKFVIANDSIDRTLPVEFQGQGADD